MATGSLTDPGAIVGPRHHLVVTRRIARGRKPTRSRDAVVVEPGLQTRDFVLASGRLAADDLAGELASFIDLQLATEDVIDAQFPGIDAELLG